MTINLTALQKQRRDTAANWTGANPTLLAGEIGIESDTNKIKIGDGSTAWTSLGYRPWSQISAYPIVNADVAAAAAISYSKLATLTSANIVLGSSANVATSTAVTGDVTIGNTGVTAIAAGVIVDADVNASAAIAGTKVSPNFGAQTVITTGSGLIGTATSLSTSYSGAGKLQAASNNATTIQGYAFSSAGVDYSATLELSRARGTQASPTIVTNGDFIGEINFAGYNTNFQRGATIYALVDGEPGTAGDTTDMPGKLIFATTPNGSATPVARMSIDNAGLVMIPGDLTVNGTTTTINSTTLVVQDKNIEMGVVATPTDVTADGGGITLKGTTDKTINWIDATDAWTFSEHVNIASAKEYRIAGTKVLDATSLGSAVVSSSLTSVGTISVGVWNGTAIADTYLGTISTALKVSNSATTATSANTASAIVARDASGNFTAGTITAALTGTASGNLVIGGALGTPSSGTLTNCTFPTLNQNTTGTAAGLSATLAVASGGTGVTNSTGSGSVVLSASPTFTGTVTIPTGASITAPTGLVKGDVGLGNVDNTSNATERAATATLTNKTLTSPVVNTPTGIVKGDVGLGNVDNTTDANKPVSTATQTALDLKANLASPTFTGTVTAPTFSGALTGNASTVTTNANLTGDITSVGNATAIAAGVIIDADINASAGIVDTKLATIATALKVSNSATTATSANTASAIVARDASGNFTAGTITAALTGAASSNVLKAGDTMTGVLRVTAGTAALPAITPSGDPNTGLFSPGGDQLAISTGGYQRVSIDSDGDIDIDGGTVFVDAVNNRVGIGASAPATLLEVGAAATNTARLRVTCTGTTAGNFRGFEFGNGSVFKGGLLQDESTDLISIHTPDSGQSINITSAGLVGIGTSTVNDRLEVNGVVRSAFGANTANTIQGAYRFNNPIYPNQFAAIYGYTPSSAVDQIELAFLTSGSSGTPTERLRISAAGNVGIGTTSPAVPLEVNGTIFGYTSGSATGRFLLRNSTTGVNSGGFDLNQVGVDTTLFNQSNGFLSIGTNNTERARIDSSGRLLVGTSSAMGAFYNDPSAAQHLFQLETTGFYASSFVSHGGTAPTGGCYLTVGRSRGTASGSKTLVASGDTLGVLSFQGADGNEFVEAASITAFVDGTPGADDMPGRLVFSTTADGGSSPTERMRITNGGFAKFSNSGSYQHAVTTSRYEFRSNQNDVTFNIVNTNASPTATALGCNILYPGASPNNTGCEFLYCEDSTTLRASIRSNGGLANYSANNANLSDRNAKKDITLAAGTWDCIKEWEIVNYRYKDQPDDAELNLGVIAQQVAESCPEVITIFQEAKEATEDKLAQEERLGVKEQQMYWMAIKALQEAMERIEQLETSNTDLLARVIALETA